MKKIGVIGAGLIGLSWTLVFARAGYSVNLIDTNGAKLDEARANLAVLGNGGGMSGEAGRVEFCSTLEQTVAEVDLVQECGPEDVEIKRKIFDDLDRFAPEGAILASSSSSIVCSLFTEALPGRHRCLIAHPLNPPHLAPLVELCGAPWTSSQTIAAAKAIYEDAGQVPIVITKEIEGFVLNRLQAALLAEALRLVGDGVVSAGDLDKTVSDGLGLRWSFLGPFGTIELNAPGGIHDYLERYGGAFQRITATPPPPDVWGPENVRRVVESWGTPPSPEELAARSAWRDRRLEALRHHKQSQDILVRE